MSSTTTVASIMTRDVFAVRADTALDTIATLFTEKHISGAPVIDADHRPIGVITLADLVDPQRKHSDQRGEAKFYHLGEGKTSIHWGDDEPARHGVVGDVMSSFVLAVEPGTSFVKAAQLMVSEGVHRLLVVERNRLVGIVSSIDLLGGFVGRGGA